MRAANQEKLTQFYARVRGEARAAFEDGLWNRPKRVYGDSAVKMYIDALKEAENLERLIQRARDKYISKRTLQELNKRRIQDWNDNDLELLHKLLEEEADELGLLVLRATATDSSTPDREPPATGADHADRILSSTTRA